MDKAITPVLLAGQRVQRARVELVATNLANLATDGFRAQAAIASEHVMSRGGASISMPRLAASLSDQRPGAVQATGSPLDFAIEGEGAFMLALPDGRQVLTRAGHFMRDAEGNLAAPDGALVLDEAGQPIALPPGAAPVAAAPDGTLSIDGAIVARLGVFAVDPVADPDARLPGARREAADAPQPVVAPRVRQGMIEGSNVSPVESLAEMIDASRSYEMIQSLIEEDDRRVRNVIETFSRQT
ncbi:MAG: flagellar hook-basal body complex protein [Pseudomonadota bacterium]